MIGKARRALHSTATQDAYALSVHTHRTRYVANPAATSILSGKVAKASESDMAWSCHRCCSPPSWETNRWALVRIPWARSKPARRVSASLVLYRR